MSHPSIGHQGSSGFRPSRAERRRQDRSSRRHSLHRQRGQSVGTPPVILAVQAIVALNGQTCPIGQPCQEHEHLNPDGHACGRPITTLVEFLPGQINEWGGPACDDHALERVSEALEAYVPNVVAEFQRWLLSDRNTVFVVQQGLGGEVA